MLSWNTAALWAYYHLTLPYRLWRQRRGPAPVCVLFYHRVADTHLNEWTIRPRDFQRRLDWMERRFDFVSLAEAQRRLREGNPRPAVALTFDDGYAENCEFALPLLLKRRIPFAYFVATDFVLHGKAFPHDEGEYLAPPNTPEQIRALADAGVEIGAHTRTHRDLGKVDCLDMLQEEVLGSAEDLEEITDRPVRYFAFPYGMHRNLHAGAFAICREANFAGVLSAYGGYNFPGDNPFHLQRIHGDPELIRLKNWLTVDPRKVATIKRFHDQPLAAACMGAVS